MVKASLGCNGAFLFQYWIKMAEHYNLLSCWENKIGRINDDWKW